MFWTGGLFRFYFSCCEVFNTIQKACFCKFIVGSKKFLKLFYLIRFWYLCSHILLVCLLVTFYNAWVSFLFWENSCPTFARMSPVRPDFLLKHKLLYPTPVWAWVAVLPERQVSFQSFLKSDLNLCCSSLTSPEVVGGHDQVTLDTVGCISGCLGRLRKGQAQIPTHIPRLLPSPAGSYLMRRTSRVTSTFSPRASSPLSRPWAA